MALNEREAAWLLKDKYHGIANQDYQTDLEKLKQGEPLAYLIGNLPFLDCTITLDSRPLIPRVETEYWVGEIIKAYSETKTSPRAILDLCAGSGCIGVALGRAFSQALVDFVEIDSAHHPTIKSNCLRNQLKNPTRILAGHLFTDLPKNQSYDLIVSNPPYVDSRLKRVAKTVRNYEPALALYGGRAGLEIIAEIIALSPNHLAPGGALWLEHEPEQAREIVALGAKRGFLTTTHLDQYQTPRFSKLLLQ